MTGTRLDRARPTLILLPRTDAPHAVPAALPDEVVAPVPIRLPDQFHSLREVAALPNTPFRLHMAALSWCSVNHTGGLITRDDFALVAAQAHASGRHATDCEGTGAWHDARFDCGSEHCLGPVDADGWVVHDFYRFDAPDEAQSPTEEAAALARRRAADAERKRRERERKAAQSEEAPRKRGRPRKANKTAKPQVENRSRDIGNKSRDQSRDPVIDKDLDQDPYLHGEKLNPDQDQNQDEVTARERNRAPRVVRATLRALCKKTGNPVSDDGALFAITVLEFRAEKAGTVIHDPEKYFPAAVRKEADVTALLPGVVQPAEATTGTEAPPWDPVTPLDALLSSREPHEFIPDPNDKESCLQCTLPKINLSRHPKYLQARSA